MKKDKFLYLMTMALVLTVTSLFTVHANEVNLKQVSLAPAPSQMKEFEFLVGNWTAVSERFSPDGTLTGQYKGTWEAQFLDEGRVLLDQVTWFNKDGSKESFFPTLRTFSPETNQWEMTYMASLSYMHSQSFRGQFIDGEGRFDAVVSLAPEQTELAKVRFYDIKKDSLEWSMMFSGDGGKTWFLGERISAKRVH